MSSSDFKFLHTMMRVMDLQKSINFYTKFFKMTLIRKRDYPGGKFTLAFLGYGPEDSNTVLELTHNWDQKNDYNKGDAWGHIAIGVKDIYNLCASLESNGVDIIRQPGPMKHGTTVIAFIKDPDNYSIELIQK
ncbi:MAG: Lactoylglutathione lyase [Alphaproteobacteria bacterium MarineAlpha9_Bin3]|nr:MAG: Lactoylglutathione lyase [Alphaproteobacteria bacterium MarineAlpha9_Bin3]|tara:strand:+ start:21850 stop:22248 length:399 start_codon:yes stop_codon:yes gene_type:complete